MPGKEQPPNSLPASVTEYINLVIRKIKYRHKVRQDVRQELTDHFTDALAEYQTDPQRQQAAEKLIADFGDPKTLATLIRRGKKRCRPLWKKFIIRSFQAVGLFIILFCFYTWWFLTGKPSISVDYVALLNQTSRPEVADEDNAWPHYEKAMDLYVEPDESIKDTVRYTDRSNEEYKSFSELNQAEQQALLQWIQQNEPAWQALKQASEKPYCWREIRADSQDQWLINLSLPRWGHLRNLLRSRIWQLQISPEKGNDQKALESYLIFLKVGRHLLKQNSTIIEQMVGLAISNIGYKGIISICIEQRIAKEDLQNIREQLVHFYSGGYPMMDVRSEKYILLDTIQRVFTEGGIGGGHIIPAEMIKIMDGMDGLDKKVDDAAELFVVTALGMIHAGRNETIELANTFYDDIENLTELKPYELRQNNIDQKFHDLSPYKYYLLRHFTPVLGRIAEYSFRGKATYEATLTILALRQRQIEKGAYPETLAELVTEEYLRQLPEDPYSDGILHYEKRGENFVLYSLGSDFDDDGGVQNPKLNYEWGDYERSGDRVFWPVSDKQLK